MIEVMIESKRSSLQVDKIKMSENAANVLLALAELQSLGLITEDHTSSVSDGYMEGDYEVDIPAVVTNWGMEVAKAIPTE